MSYNYPAGYQPYYSPTSLNNPGITPTIQNNIQSNLIWVQGEAGAKSYMVAPNNTVQLWDSESQTIYLKSADASGMPSMKVLDYTIRQAEGTPSGGLTAPKKEFATKDELSTIQSDIEALRGKLEALERGGRNAKYRSDDKSNQKFSK